MYDLLIQDALVLSCSPVVTDILKKASVLIGGNIIEDIIPHGSSLPDAKRIINHKNKLLTPGLIDCHTHLIYGGNRVNELEKRIKGGFLQRNSRRRRWYFINCERYKKCNLY